MSKITAYAALTTPAVNDELPIVDVSDTTMAPTGTTKNITVANLLPDPGWLPSDNGLLAATYDISACGQTTGALTAGVLYLARVMIRTAITATNIWWLGNTGGTGASTGSFTGLYNSAGTLLSGTADVAAKFQATGAQSAALTTPQALAAGTFAWVAMLSNLASTQPVFRSGPGPSFSILNLNLSAANSRSASSGTGQTALPASFTPGSLAQSGIAVFWAGIS